MNKDYLKKLATQTQPLKNHLADIERSLGGKSPLARLLDDMERHKKLISTAYGPTEELRRSGLLFAVSKLNPCAEQLNKTLVELNKRFELSDINRINELMSKRYFDLISSFASKFDIQPDFFRETAVTMNSPWLNIEDQARSVGGFVHLQAIGFAIGSTPSFDDRLSELLRSGLGDWQERIAIPKAVFEDPIARSDFYQKRGFDPALTAFPREAFGQSLDLAKLRSAPTQIVEAYDYEEAQGLDEGEAAFERTNAAHDRLQRLESRLRQFIDKKMTDVFGNNWIKQRVPNQIRTRWLEKQEKASSNGEINHPLIAYSDFTDYMMIIVRSDNWKEIFEPIFRRKESIQESLQRLYPIRNCTMHSRMITQDDELLLYVEVKRIIKAIES